MFMPSPRRGTGRVSWLGPAAGHEMCGALGERALVEKSDRPGDEAAVGPFGPQGVTLWPKRGFLVSLLNLKLNATIEGSTILSLIVCYGVLFAVTDGLHPVLVDTFLRKVVKNRLGPSF